MSKQKVKKCQNCKDKKDLDLYTFDAFSRCKNCGSIWLDPYWNPPKVTKGDIKK